ncbi:MAG: phage tail protein [Acidimicrobiales bacterium]
MGIIDGLKLGLANRFRVVINPGDHDLGTWAKVDGLKVTWETPDYRAGDAGNYRWFAPSYTKYTEVKLARAACEDSNKVKDWLSKTSFEHTPHEVTIELFDASYTAPIVTWELKDAMPHDWGIQGFDAGASKVAIEELSFTHNGFLLAPDERKLS